MIQSLCKRIVLLQNGEVVKDGKVEDVFPYYQNIVYKKNEEDLKLKMSAIDGRVRIDKKSLMEITQVSITNGKMEPNLNRATLLKFKIDYETNENLDNPIFSLEIIRADGGYLCLFFQHK